MYSNYTDQELLSLLQQDSVNAFNVIYERYSQPLYLYILSKIDGSEAGKDVLQDLFTSLWERRQSISVNESLKSYLYQSARHKIIDIYRKNSTYRKYLQQLIEHFDVQPGGIAELVDSKTRTQDVFETINHLPERMKEIFMLSRVEHQTVEQIAVRLGLSQQTVKNQITKALKILRANHARTDLVLFLLTTQAIYSFFAN
ncbi:RNA polymerase sigma factor [Chitinophaga pinensis]|uniref:Transcriptional regulator, LuxR family n=1 Tax=Chitinophaga pinensis (strain ATCC 43595 / DSM 2588 / LMG 13176 / NBRC 15968 / NCIMB 11800 / UQM 2034) TaxID=485918 RepID=A0A979G2C2_CHIPD|nr:RNA polymerase sigma-70 factor [Chitinophaga pinensis]ACU59386.1 transcriptional regulator, LuxR family [Chitinophaga pinensis DSM 2588]